MFHQYELIAPSLDLPPGFDPLTHRILAKHWFGVEGVEIGVPNFEADYIGGDKKAA